MPVKTENAVKAEKVEDDTITVDYGGIDGNGGTVDVDDITSISEVETATSETDSESSDEDELEDYVATPSPVEEFYWEETVNENKRSKKTDDGLFKRREKWVKTVYTTWERSATYERIGSNGHHFD